jgi:exodeoxyribonuclease-5
VQLTTGQQEAFDLLAPIFNGNQPGARAVLTGYAGTGKTTLTARLIQLASVIPGALGVRGHRGKWVTPPTVVITAPTHKAARQLERSLASWGLDQIKAVTLHSALGLRPVREGGTETFEPDPKAARLIGATTRLVVVDECSMVSAALVALLEAAMPPDAALVAIGDPAQLPPVDDPAASPLFNAPIHAHLDQVMRHGGAILQLATATRELGTGRPAFVSQQEGSSKVVAYEHFTAWKKTAIRACLEAHQRGDTDLARVLCWTNNAADRFNRDAHAAIYGPTADSYVVGQPVVSAGVILGPDGQPMVGSTAEMQLLDVYPVSGAIAGDELQEVREALLGKRKTKKGEVLPPWSWWQVEARLAGKYGRLVSFKVLAPGREAEWRKANNAIAALARAAKEAGDEAAAKEIWQIFWRRKDGFAGINPVWGLTVHKSQGSTFKHVFLHPDLNRNADFAAMNQLVYVGVTRASVGLHVVAGPALSLSQTAADAATEVAA